MMPLDVEFALIDTRRRDARWLVVVLTRMKSVGLGRYAVGLVGTLFLI